MKNTIKITATIAVLAGLLIAPSVLASEVTKDGTEITVTEPTVEVQKQGDSFYDKVDVTVKTDIPDDVEINQGDTLTMPLPQELELETNYEFAVTNNEGAEVGQATAKAKENTVTTVFNDYFKEHPLNKSISLNLQTKINSEIVREEGKMNLNFSGTIVEMESGSKGDTNPNEELYKWGYQDKEDPNVVHWVARINYRKATMNRVSVSDTWDNEARYVPGSMKISYLHSANPWTYAWPGNMDMLSMRENGFDYYVGFLNNVLVFEYSTRYATQATVPVNTIKVTANDYWIEHKVDYKWVSGSGTADGKNRPKPIWEIPNEAPQVDKPELNINDIPLMPPAPILDKPELDLNDVPLLPPAPILELPKLVIPDEHKPELPPKTLEKEPPSPSSDKEEPKNAVESKLEASARELPKTGEVSNVFLSIFGISLLISGTMIWQDNKKK
jgi:LPXTG-motif cell wall-anchored protein